MEKSTQSGSKSASASQAPVAQATVQAANAPLTPTFGGVFGGLEKWLYDNIGKPIESNITDIVAPLGVSLAGLTSDVGGLSSSLASLGVNLTGVGDSIAAFYLFMKDAVPGLRADVTKSLGASEKLLSEMPDWNTLVTQFDTGISDIKQFGSNLATYGEELKMVAPLVSQIAPEVTLIEKGVNEVAPEIEQWYYNTGVPEVVSAIDSWWKNTAFPEIQKEISGALPALETGITDIENGITSINKEISKTLTELENLPKTLESDVESGIKNELDKVWKKIELPTIAFAGIMTWLWLRPHNQCCQPKKVHWSISNGKYHSTTG